MRKGRFVPFILALAVALFVSLLMSANALRSFGQQKRAASPDDLLRGAGTGATRVVDMTHPINGNLPAWPGDDKTFEAQVVATPGKDGYLARSFWMLEHYATHMEEKVHFPQGNFTLDQIAVAHFFGPAVEIDVREEVIRDPDYRLNAAIIEKWEAWQGRIPSSAIVMMRT